MLTSVHCDGSKEAVWFMITFRSFIQRKSRPVVAALGSLLRFRNVVLPLLFGAILVFTHAQQVHAGPKDGNVVAGDANIVQLNPKLLEIIQGSDKVIIDWRSFSIDWDELVRFLQPDSDSIALNRVNGDTPSYILGQLTADGRVMLINPNGVLFGDSAVVDIGSLVATTIDIRNEDFMAGDYNFDVDRASGGTVVNRGRITAAEGGIVALVAPGVENSGVIVARLGRVALASGNSFALDFYGDRLIQIGVDDSVAERLLAPDGTELKALVDNSGEIYADGGTVMLMAASVAKDVVDYAINMEGIIEARTATERNGQIVLEGAGEGIVRVTGTLDASGRESGETGGEVKILGSKVGLVGQAEVDVSGDAGGGEVLIGGNFQGRGPERNADFTTIGSEVAIQADALTTGDGGRVIVWSDRVTRFYGNISARGGRDSGDGGFAEISGKQHLQFAPNSIDLSAPKGLIGELLLDPLDIVISDGDGTDDSAVSGDNVINFNDDSTATYNITPAAFEAIDADITLQALRDITVSSPIDRTGSGDSTLSLQAGRHLIINADITGTNGAHSFIFEADSPKSSNNDGSGKLTIASGVTITSNDGDITLIGAAFDINATGSINAGTGDIHVAPSRAIAMTISAAASDLSNTNLSNAEIGTFTTSGTIYIGTATTGPDGTGGAGSPISASSITVSEALTISGSASLVLRALSDITVSSAIDLSGSADSTLTLQAGHHLTINADITGTNGVHGLILEADLPGSSNNDGVGTLTIAGGVTITSNNGDITLIGAAFDIDATGSINAGTGDIHVAPSQAVGMTISKATDHLSNAEIGRFTTSGTIYIGTATTGPDGSGGGGSSISATSITVSEALTFSGSASLVLDSGGTTTLSADVSTEDGDITFGDAVILGADVTVDSDADDDATDGDITFTSTVDGGHMLTVKAGGGTVELEGAVGGTSRTTKLSGLTVDGGRIHVDTVATSGDIDIKGSTSINLKGVTYESGDGDITFTGAGDVTISGSASPVLRAGRDITVSSSIDVIGSADSTLVLRAGRDITVSSSIDVIGSADSTLVLRAGRHLTINADITGTDGAHGFIFVAGWPGTLTISSGVTITSNNGDITLIGAAFDINATSSINAGTGDIHVAPSHAFLMTIGAAADTVFNTVFNTNLSNAEIGRLTTSGTIYIGTATTGPDGSGGGGSPISATTITVSEALTISGSASLVLRAGTDITVNSAIDLSGSVDSTLTLQAGHHLTINADITGTNGAHGLIFEADSTGSSNYVDVGELTIRSGVTITSNNGDITLIGAAFDIKATSSINAGTGDIHVAPSRAVAMTISTAADNLSNVEIGRFTTSGTIRIGTATTGPDGSGGGGSPISATSITVGEALTISGGASIVLDTGGTTTLSADVSTEDGDITFGDAVILGADVTVASDADNDATDGDITFTSTVDGGYSLTLDADSGSVTVSGATGGTTKLSGLTVDGGQIDVDAVATTGDIDIDGSTNITLNGAIYESDDGDIILAGAGGVTISGSASLVLRAGRDITVSSSIDVIGSADSILTLQAGRHLTINADITGTDGAHGFIFEADSPGSANNDGIGTLTIAGGVTITSNNGAITLIGAGFDINATGSIDAGTGDIHVAPSRAVSMTISAAADNLGNAEIGTFTTSGTIRIGTATTGPDGSGGAGSPISASSITVSEALTIGGSASLVLRAGSDITVSSSIDLSGSVDSTLALQAGRHLTINADITGTNGAHSLIFEADSLGSSNNDNSGKLRFDNNVTITSNNGDITLIGAAFDINATSSIDAGTGDIHVAPSRAVAMTISTSMDNLSNAEIGRFTTSGTIRIGTATTGPDSSGGGGSSISATSITVIEALTISGSASLVLDSGGTTTLRADVSTDDGDITFGDAVILGADVTVASDADNDATDGDITFTSTVDGGYSLTLDADSGSVTVSGATGGTTKLSGLTVDGGQIDVDAVATTGDIDIDGSTNITLNGATYESDDGDIILAGAGGVTISGSASLVLRAGRDLAVSSSIDVIGSADSILALQAGRHLTINADITGSNGVHGLIFEADSPGSSNNDGIGTLTIAGGVTITSNNGDITLIGAGFDINATGSIDAGTGDIRVAPSRAVAMTISNAVTADLSNAEIGRFTTSGTIRIGTATTGPDGSGGAGSPISADSITVSEALTISGSASLVLRALSDITVSSAIDLSGSADSTLTLQAGRHLIINADITGTNGAHGLIFEADSPGSSNNDGVGTLTIAGGVTITSNNGDITLIGAGFGINATGSIDAGTGDIHVAPSRAVAMTISAAADNLSNAEIGRFTTSGTIRIGTATTGPDSSGGGGSSISATSITVIEALTISGSASLVLDSSGTTTLRADVSTDDGDITFGDAVILGAGVTVASDADNDDTDGDITFTSTVDGGYSLTLDADSGSVTVSGATGGTTKLSGLTVDGGQIDVDAVATTGDIDIDGSTNITLNGATYESDDGDIILAGAGGVTISGSTSLVLRAGRDLAVSSSIDVIGSADSILALQAGRHLTINADITGTDGAHGFIFEADSPGSSNNDGIGTLTIAGGVTITSNNGAITLIGAAFDIDATSSIDAGTGDIHVAPSRAVAMTIGAAADNLGNAEIGRFTTSGTIRIGTATTGPDGSGGGGSPISASSITVSEALTISGSASLVLRALSDITVSSSIDLSGSVDSTLTLQAGRHLIINADITGTNGAHGLILEADSPGSSNNDGVGTLTIASGVTITSNNGDITLIGAGFDIDATGSINAGTGDIHVAPSRAVAMTISSAVTANLSNVEIGRFTTSGTIRIGTATTGPDGSGGGGSPISATSITVGEALTISGSTSLVLDSGGTTTLSADVSTEDGDITFGDAVILGADVTVASDADNDATDGDITFTSTVDGGQMLTLDADSGSVTVSGATGGTTALTSLTVDGGRIEVDAVATTGDIDIDGSTNIALNGAIYESDDGDITLAGAGGVTISGNASLVLRAGRDITVSSSIDVSGSADSILALQAGRHLTINADITGTNGAHGFILEADSPGSSNNDGVGTLTIASGVTITSNNGAITLIGAAFEINATSGINAGTGDIHVAPSRAVAMTISAAADNLSNAEIGRFITSGTIRIGTTTTGPDGSGGAGSPISASSITVSEALTISGSASLVLRALSDITVSSSIDLSGSADSTLTLQAGHHLIINADITGTDGVHGLILEADSPGSSNNDGVGTLTIASGVTITSNNGDITLIGAGFDIDATGSINAGTGDIHVAPSRAVAMTISSAVTANLSNVEIGRFTTSGTIRIGTATTGPDGSGGGGSPISASSITVGEALTISGSTSLVLDSGGTTTLSADVSTDDGDITFGDAVILGADVTVDSDADDDATDGDIIFTSTVDGGHALTLDAGGGAVDLRDAVGGTTALASLTVDGGRIDVDAVATTGDIDIDGSTNIDLNGAIYESDDGDIILTGAGGVTISGSASLVLRAGRDLAVSFSIDVSGSADSTLALQAGRHLTINADITGSNGAHGLIFEADSPGTSNNDGIGTLTIAGDVTITSNNGDITLIGAAFGINATSSINAGTGDIHVAPSRAVAMTISAAVENQGDNLSNTEIGRFTTSGTIRIGTATTGPDGSGGAGSPISASSITVSEALTISGSASLVLRALSDITVSSSIDLSGSADSTLALQAGRHLTINANITGTNGAHGLILEADSPGSSNNDGVGTLTIGSGVTITSNNGDITLIGAAFDINATGSIDAGTGDIHVAPSRSVAMTISAAADNLGNAEIGRFTTSGTIRIGTATTGPDGSGSLISATSITVGEALTISGSTSLVLDSGGTTTLSADVSTDDGDITFGDAVILGADVTVDSDADDDVTDGDITFTSTVDGGHALTLDAGGRGMNLRGAVGGTTKLASLTVVGGVVSLESVSTTGTIGVTGSGITLGGAYRSDDGAITFTGAVDLHAHVTVDSDADDDAMDGAITFTSTVDGHPILTLDSYRRLTLDAGGGAVDLRGAVGGTTKLASLTVVGGAVSLESVRTTGAIGVTGSGITLGGDYRTNDGDITFTGPVDLAETVTSVPVNSDADNDGKDGDITFTSTVDGHRHLNLDAGGGSVSLRGAVGGTTALASLTVDGHNINLDTVATTGNIDIDGSNNIYLHGATYESDDGDIIFNGDSLRLYADVTVDSDADNDATDGDITFTGSVYGNQALTLDADDGSVTVVSGRLGGPTASWALTSLTVEGGAVSLWSVRTTGAIGVTGSSITLGGAFRSYDGNITFTGPVILAYGVTVNSDEDNDGTDGDITFTSTVDGHRHLTLDAGSGSVELRGAVGGTTALISLTVDGGQIDLDTVATTRNIDIEGTNIDLNGATYESNSRGITFTGAVDLHADVTVNSDADGILPADNIIFTSTVDGGYALMLDSGDHRSVELRGAVGGTTALASLTVDGRRIDVDTVATTGDIDIEGKSIDLNGATYESDDGDIIFTGEVTISGSASLVLRAGRDLAVSSSIDVRGSADSILVLQAGRHLTINAHITGSSGAHSFIFEADSPGSLNNDGVGKLTIGSGVAITSNNGDITLIGAAFDIDATGSINAGTGDIHVAPSRAVAMTISAAADNLGNAEIGWFTTSGTIRIGTATTGPDGSGGAGSPISASSITVSETLTISGSASLVLWAVSDITVSSAIDLSGSSDSALTLQAGRHLTINADITGTNGAHGLIFEADSPGSSNNDGIGKLTIGSGVTITSDNGDITLIGAAFDIDATGSINAGTGDIHVAPSRAVAMTISAAADNLGNAEIGRFTTSGTIRIGTATTGPNGSGGGGSSISATSITVSEALTISDSASLVLDTSGTTTLSEDVSTDDGDIIFGDAVILGADVTVDSDADNDATDGAITFTSTVDGGYALTLDAGGGAVELQGAVGGSTILTSLTVDGGRIDVDAVATTGDIDIDGSTNIALNGAIYESDDGDIILAGAGGVTISGSASLVLRAGRDLTVSSSIDVSGGADSILALQAGRHLTINADITGTDGAHGLIFEADSPGSSNNDGTGKLTIGSGVTITSNNGDITLIGAAFDISATGSIDAGTGDIHVAPSQAVAMTISAAVENQGDNLSNTEIGRFTTSGTIRIGTATTGPDGSGGAGSSISATTITVIDALTISGSTSLVLRALRDIFVFSSIDLSGGAGSSLTLQAGRHLTIAGDITGSSGAHDFIFEADSPGSSNNDGTGKLTIGYNATITSDNGDITLIGAAFEINATSSINAGTGDIYVTPSRAVAMTISNAADNLGNAEIGRFTTSGTIRIGTATTGPYGSGGVGSSISATSITVSEALTISGSASLILDSSGTTTLSADVSTDDGDITFGDAVILGADVTVDSDADDDATDGEITFTLTVDGGHALTLDADSGAVTVSGATGGTTKLSGLTVDGGRIDVDAVATTGDIDIDGSMNIALNGAIYESDDGDIILAGAGGVTISGSASLILRAGRDLTVSSSIDVSGSADSILALQAGRHLTINADITGTNGAHDLILEADSPGSSNNDGTGKLTIGSGVTITSNNGAITLIGAAFDINATGSINAGTGDIHVAPSQAVAMTISSAVTANLGNAEIGRFTTSGTIRIGTATTGPEGSGGAGSPISADSITVSEALTISGSASLVLRALSDITVSSAIDLSGSADSALTLQAGRHLTINADITGTNGAHGLIFEADSPGSSNNDGVGTLTIASGVTITSDNGDITLIGAAFDIDATGSINAGTGDIHVAPSQAVAMTISTAAANLSNTEIGRFTTSGTIRIGTATTGPDGSSGGGSPISATSITVGEALTISGSASLVLNSSGMTTLRADVSTEDGDITFGDAVILGADVTVASDADDDATDGDITFTSTVDGGHALTLDAGGGAVDLRGAVGGTTKLSGLTVDGGQIDVDAVATTGDIDIDGSTNIALNGAIYESDDGDITLAGAGGVTISGSASLILRAGRDLTVSSSIDVSGSADSTLALQAGRHLTINADITGSNGAHDFIFEADSPGSSNNDGTGKLTIGSGVTITSNNGDITLIGAAFDIDATGSINAGTGDIHVAPSRAVAMTISAAADNLGSAEIGRFTTSGTIRIGTATTGPEGSGGAGSPISASSITVSEVLTISGSASLVLRALSDITVSSAIDLSGSADSALTLQAGRHLTVNADITGTNGAHGLILEADSPGSSNNDGVGTLTIANGVTITSNNGDITLIGAGFDIDATGSINAGTGDIHVAPSQAVAMTISAAAANLGNAEIGRFTTSGTIRIGTATTGPDGSGGVGSSISATSITVSEALTISGSTSLVLDSSGMTTLRADVSTEDGDITFGDAVILGADVTVASDADDDATDGDITFTSMVDGGQMLTLDADSGAVTVSGAVGGTTKLSGLTVDGGRIDVDAVATTGDIDIDGSTNIALSGAIYESDDGDITFTGAGGVTISGSASLILRAGRDLTVSSSIDVSGGADSILTLQAGRHLAVNADITGTNGAHGFIFEADSPGSSNNDGIGTLTIAGGVTITSDNGDITLIGAAFDISATGSINAGTGDIHVAPSRAVAMTISAAADILGNKLSNAEIGRFTTSGTIRIGTATTGPDGSGGGGSPISATSITVSEALTISDSASLVLDSSGMTTLSADVSTDDGDITFGDAVILGADVMADSDADNDTTDGAITFTSTVDGGYALTLDADSGSVTVSGAMGGTTKLSGLTVDGGQIDVDAVATTGDIDIDGSTNIALNGAIYESDDGDIILTGAGGVTISGSASPVLRAGRDLTVSSAIDVSGSADSILTLQAGRHVTINADITGTNGAHGFIFEADSPGLNYEGSGKLTIAGGVTITSNNGDITLIGAAFDIDATSSIDAGTGDIHVAPSRAVAMTISAAADNLRNNLSNAEIGRFTTSGTIHIGTATTGPDGSGGAGSPISASSITVSETLTISGSASLVLRAVSDITVSSAIDLSGSADSTLTLQAGRHLTINAGITGTNGAHDFVFEADSPGSSNNDGSGKLRFDNNVTITSNNGDITLIAAAFDINATSSIDAGTGDIHVAPSRAVAMTISAAADILGNKLSNAQIGRFTTSGTIYIGTATTGPDGSGGGGSSISATSITVSEALTISGSASLVLDSGGTTTLREDVSTEDGDITFGDAVILRADVTVDSDADDDATDGDITFTSTVDGGHALTLDAGGGAVELQGAVGGTTTLTSLTVDGSQIDVDTVATTGDIDISGSMNIDLNGATYESDDGDITFTGAVDLHADVTVDSDTDDDATDGDITFTSTVDGGQALTLDADSGSVTVSGAVGGTTALASLTVDGGQIDVDTVATTGDIDISGSMNIDLNGATYESDDGDIILAGAGGVTISGSASLVLRARRDLTVSSSIDVSGGADSVLALQAGRHLTINADITGTNGVHGLIFEADSPGLNNDGVGTLTVASGVTIRSNNGDITLIGAAFDIRATSSINAGTGDIHVAPSRAVVMTISNAVTADLSNAEIGRFTTSGTIRIGTATTGLDGSGGAGSPISATTITVIDALTISGSASLVLRALRNIFVFSSIDLSGSADSTLALQAGHHLTIDADITGTNGAHGFILEADSPGSSNNDGVGKLTIARGVTITSNNGDITLIGAAFDIRATSSIDAGTGDIHVAPSRAVAMTISTSVDNLSNAEIGRFTTSGTIHIGTATTGPDGSGGGGSSISATSITVIEDLAISGSTSLVLDSGDTTTLRADVSTDDGDITFGDAVILGADVTVDSDADDDATDGAITFTSTVDGGYALTLDADSGSVTVSGAMGGTTKLGSLTVDGGQIDVDAVATTGDIDIDGSTNIDLNGATYESDDGDITFTGAVDLHADVTVDSDADDDATDGDITFTSTVDGGQALTLDADSGSVTVSGAVGGTTTLTSLTLDGGQIDVDTVATTGDIDISGSTNIDLNGATYESDDGDITFTGTVDLHADVTVDSDADDDATDGDITFTSTVDGGQALTLDADSGSVTVSGVVGGTTALTSLTVVGGTVSLEDVNTTDAD